MIRLPEDISDRTETLGIPIEVAVQLIGTHGVSERLRPVDILDAHEGVVGEAGRDCITQHMLALSTYLGHSKVAHTYWYLEATSELMRKVAERCESFVTGEKP